MTVADDEERLDPEVRPDVVVAEREQEADGGQHQRRRTADRTLEEHRGRSRVPVPRMAARRLVDPDRVSADRRREYLACRIGDEVGPRQPGNAVLDALRPQHQLPAPRHREDRHDHDREREEEVERVGVRDHVDRLADVDLPEDVRGAEPRDEQGQRDANRPAHRERVVDPAQRGDRVRDVGVGVCGRQRQGEHLGAGLLGDRQRRLVGKALAVRREHVDRQEVDARRDVLLGEAPLVLVARAAGPLGVDADDVEVVRVGVALVARERLDAVELGDRLVVGRELAPPDLAVLLQLVELDERDRGQHVGEVRLVAGDDDVVERAVPAAHEPQVLDRLGDPRVVRRDQAPLARGEVLRRVEGEARDVGDRRRSSVRGTRSPRHGPRRRSPGCRGSSADRGRPAAPRGRRA